jgi:hypothetical protein
MEEQTLVAPPEKCPACDGELEITRMQCTACGTEVAGRYAAGRLVNLGEPYASVLELFLKVRGNVKEMERRLGLSYPTVRSRLEEAFDAAGLARAARDEGASVKDRQRAILHQLQEGAIPTSEAISKLREIKAVGNVRERKNGGNR